MHDTESFDPAALDATDAATAWLDTDCAVPLSEAQRWALALSTTEINPAAG